MSTQDVIHEIVKSAPAGNFDALLQDIQQLMGSAIPPEVLQPLMSRHEHDTCAGSSSVDVSHHPLALSLNEELDKYQARLSKTKETSAVSFRAMLLPGSTDKELLLRTYAECVDDKNSKTGSWSSEWTISFHGVTAEILGTVTVTSFSYEGGNFQLRSTNKFPTTTLQGESLATAIFQHVSSCEQEVLLSVKNSCAQSSHNLKSIRGILPMTHKRLNWNLLAHRTVRTLQDTVAK